MRVLAFSTTVIAAAVLTCGRVHAQTQDVSSCTSSIRVLINQYNAAQIPTGATIWFSGVLEGVQSASDDLKTTPVRIDVRHAQITFGKWPHTVNLPDSTIQIDPAATDPQRWWVDNASWSLTLAPSQIPEAFFDGAPYVAPEAFLPGDSGPITWTATFTASRPGISLSWAWSAAVYSKFGENGRLLVKPLNIRAGAPQPAMYQNDDPAGTPELYKQYVVAGAMGNGAPQYTGTRSETATVQPCVAAQPPPAVRQLPSVQPVFRSFLVQLSALNAEPFASKVSTRFFSDGTIGKTVEKCDTTDLCATILYHNADRVAIYSEGAAKCDRYMLYITRERFGRTVYAFSRSVASLCARASTAVISMDAGKIRLGISRNADGSLKFAFAP